MTRPGLRTRTLGPGRRAPRGCPPRRARPSGPHGPGTPPAPRATSGEAGVRRGARILTPPLLLRAGGRTLASRPSGPGGWEGA